MMKRWETLSSRYLLERWWLRLRVDRVRLGNGIELEEFHIVEYPDWATTVCVTESGEVVLVEQYRYGIDRSGLELPAGAVSPGEDPLAAARRELLEETGYMADEWHFLCRCAQEPSRESHYAHLFVARNARLVHPPAPDETEDLRVQLLSREEVLRMADAGEIQHAVHIAALFWADRRKLL